MSSAFRKLGFSKSIKKTKDNAVRSNGIVDSNSDAERKVAMGQHWHQQCFKCTTCGRFLDPGRHNEHEGDPYCNQCYKSLYGPDGLRLGTSVVPRVSLEPPQSPQEKSDILSRIKEYNMYKGSYSSEHIKHREVNDRLIYEGVLRLYWGLRHPITLSSTGGYNRRIRESMNYVSIDDDDFPRMFDGGQSGSFELGGEDIHKKMSEGQRKLSEPLVTQSLNEQVITALHNGMDHVRMIPEERTNGDDYVIVHSDGEDDDRETESLPTTPSRRVIMRQKGDAHHRANNAIVRRRSASFRKVQKQRKQALAKEEKSSKFTPPYGKSTNLRVSSIQRTEEVISMLLQKFSVDNQLSEFSLYVVHDNGAREVINPMDKPLETRLKLGPSEEVAKIYIMEANDTEVVSQEAAEYIKFQLPELNIFLRKFKEEEEREEGKIKRKFATYMDFIRAELYEQNPLHPRLLTDSTPLTQQVEA